jgi:hypothetical protein
VAGLTLILFGAGTASAQTAVPPATSSSPATEPGRFSDEHRKLFDQLARIEQQMRW